MNIILKTLIFLLFIAISLNIDAQKKKFTLKDPYTNAGVYPERLSQLQWLTDENSYSYVDDSLLMKGFPSGKDQKILSISDLKRDFVMSNIIPPQKIPRMSWINKDILQIILRDTIYNYSIGSHLVAINNLYKSESEYIKIQDVTGDVAFTEGQNLYIYSKSQKIVVTNDNIPGIVNGQTVARSEFGITHGIFWSPTGSNLAFYKKDESMVTEYPLVDIDLRPAKVEYTRYPMAGMTSEEVKVNIYNLATKKTIEIKTGSPKDQFLTNITWSPDEKYIYIAVLNRQQNHLWLNKYDAATGKFVKTLFEETNEKYVEPLEGLHFLNGSSEKFVWMSQRDGWNHAYLYDNEGKLIKQITIGNWLVNEFIGFNPDNSMLYFTSTKESPIELHLYSIEMNSGKIKKLTNNHGTHNVSLSFDKEYFTDNYSNYYEVASEYVLSDNKGKKIKTLLKSKNPLEDYNMGKTSISTIKADDGSELYYRLITPANFDASKKYPVIVYVYGGPHAQMVTDSWLGGGGFFLQYLATQGYVVFTLDNHGSANRGFAFESIVHRQLGKAEMKDQMKGIEFLKTLSYVDTNRIGVNGWSFGGFMTTSLMTNFPKTFKVGVAGGPVIDWSYYEVMYGERYMDMPQENPEGYSKTSLLDKAGNLEGHLLLIHGTVDPTVVWQNSLMFINKCVKAGKQIDYFVYPGHEHNVRGYDRLHLDTKIFNYFQDYL